MSVIKIKESLLKTIIVLLSLWVGFVSAISFMEAWLKFNATGVTLKIGVAIGSLVFNALNNVELFLSGIIIVLCFTNISYAFKVLKKILIPVLILLVQTFYLLPVLDARIVKIINEVPVENDNHHFFYVGLEIVKVISLVVIIIQIIKTNGYNQ